MDKLRFSINKSQITLLSLGSILLILLTSSTLLLFASAQQADKVHFSSEKSEVLLSDAQTSALRFTLRFEEWRSGRIDRQIAQTARAILGEELSRMANEKIAIPRTLMADFSLYLTNADALLARSGPGFISASLRKENSLNLAKFNLNFLDENRVFMVSYHDAFLAQTAERLRKLSHRQQLNMILLGAFGLNGIIFVFSIIYTSNKRYREIRSSIFEQSVLLKDANVDLTQSQNLVDQLQALDIRRNDFITTINHELRTPLTSIIGYVSLLQKNIVSGEKEQNLKLIDVIERNSNNLLELVEEILTLSNLSNVSHEVLMTKVDLHEVVSQCILLLAPQTHSSDVSIITTSEEGKEAVIAANMVQISQAIFNILSNAVKFSPPHSEVKVKISKSKDRYSQKVIKLTITDQGLGIPSSEVGEIFKSFFRASNTKNSTIPGNGLGLAITAKIIELHQGTIEVESKVGVGTTFTILLPAHLDEVDKMIINRAGGVLARAITALENSAPADLGATCHEMIGALALYDMVDQSAQVSLFSHWLQSHGNENPELISFQLDALLTKLRFESSRPENSREA